MARFFRHLFFVISCSFPIVLALVFSCGSPEAGSLTFRLVWPDQIGIQEIQITQTVATSIKPQADYANVSTIRASLWEGSEKTKESAFSYSLHDGKITAPVGTYLLRIDGLNSSGDVIYRGEQGSVIIQKGENTDAGDIVMEPYGDGTSCSDECSPSGVKQCSGNGYQTCGDYDSDGCLEWSSVTNCTSGDTCSGGVCSSTCTDECASGARECSGNGYRICGSYDSDSCLDWSSVTACGTGEACSGGYCSTTATAPSAPSNLQATAASSSQINLSWTDNSSNEDGFKIERKISAVGTYSLIQTTASNATSYSDTGLSAGTIYYYRVNAYNSAGNSGYSNEANATTQSNVPPIGMASIPAGCFNMGDGFNENGDELPVHNVCVSAFQIGVYEVTNAQYKACVDAGFCSAPSDSNSNTRNQYYGNSIYGNYPVTLVAWSKAKAFCEWAGGRLPTEAEWEYAARGGLSGKRYPWGDNDPTCILGAANGAQYYPCSPHDTIAVGSFAPNGYGLYDTVGNVWEWVNDWYDGSYYSSSPAQDPQGPSSGQYRVLRGGSWEDQAGYPYDLRVANRNGFAYSEAYDVYYDYLGFRCAK